MTDNLIMVNRIRRRMSEVGINAKQLAEKAEVGKSFVYDILNGKSKDPTPNKLSSISKHIGIPLSYIMNNEEHNIDMQKYISVRSLPEGADTTDPSTLLLTSLLKRVPNYDSFHSFNINDYSMEPTFHNGDVVIVSTSKEEARPFRFLFN